MTVLATGSLTGVGEAPRHEVAGGWVPVLAGVPTGVGAGFIGGTSRFVRQRTLTRTDVEHRSPTAKLRLRLPSFVPWVPQ